MQYFIFSPQTEGRKKQLRIEATQLSLLMLDLHESFEELNHPLNTPSFILPRRADGFAKCHVLDTVCILCASCVVQA